MRTTFPPSFVPANPLFPLTLSATLAGALVPFAAVGHWAAFACRAVPAALAAAFNPSWWIRPFYSVLIGGLPLAVVAGLAIGVVVWVHTRGVLSRTGPGATDYLPTVLAAAVFLELAPIGAGLILAARTGARLGAELAAMKFGEQVDALELIGVSPMQRLVGPRVLACVLAGPLLHAVVAALAIGSGYIAESLGDGMSWLKFRGAATKELRFGEVLAAGAKTLVFGGLVGVTGCFLGLRATGGAEGVGTAATRSVVYSVLLVLLADVLLVGLIQVTIG
ncbi:MAG TPA: ABC transporter permease [Fimbriiglobus sp.]